MAASRTGTDITRQYWQRPGTATAEEWFTKEKTELSSVDVEEHLFTWDRFRRALLGFMAQYDVLLT